MVRKRFTPIRVRVDRPLYARIASISVKHRLDSTIDTSRWSVPLALPSSRARTWPIAPTNAVTPAVNWAWYPLGIIGSSFGSPSQSI